MRPLFTFGMGVVGCLIACSGYSEAISWIERRPGVAVTIVTNEGPVIYTALRVDLSHKEFSLTTTLGKNTVLGLSTLTSQLSALPKELGVPVAAMNGDFFMMRGAAQGDPRGLHIFRGELVSVPAGPAAFWQTPDGRLHGGKVSSRLTISWPGGGRHLAGLNEQLGTNSLALFTPRMGRLNVETEGRTGRFGPRFSRPAETNAPLAPGPIRPPGGREWLLEHSGSGPWLPLRVGQTYHARVRAITDGFDEVSEGTMVLSLGPKLFGSIPVFTNGGPVTIRVGTDPDLTGVQTAIGTGPMLVHGGQPYDVEAYKSDQLHPRSALGWSGKFLYFAAADGRQSGLSIGVRLEQIADFLVGLGCREAINMDGGQSTEIVLEGRILNNVSLGARWPSQPGREGNISNAIVILRKPAAAETDD